MYNTLKAAIVRELKEQEKKTADYIRNGRENAPDAGIERYGTATRWNQYKSGAIDREKAVELALKQARKHYEKREREELEKLEAAENAEKVIAVSVNVEWHKSRTWGANPIATVTAYTESGRAIRTTGTASGCGYDKESAATAQAFNQIPGLMRELYRMKNKALRADKTASSHTAINYGAGYGVRPYFEGGVGFSCHEHMLNKAGFKTASRTHGKMWDSYYFSR